jgi:multiple sugar transport system permease protein
VSTIDGLSATSATSARGSRRQRATFAGASLRMFTLVLFALFFAVPLVWLVLATTKNGEQLYFGAPLSFGSVNHLVRNWQQLMSLNGDAFGGWFGNSVEYACGATAIVLLVDIPAGFGLAICSVRVRRPFLLVTLVAMLIPNNALVLPIFLEMFHAHLVGNPLSVILPFAFFPFAFFPFAFFPFAFFPFAFFPFAFFPFGVYLAYIYFSTSIPSDMLVGGSRLSPWTF